MLKDFCFRLTDNHYRSVSGGKSPKEGKAMTNTITAKMNKAEGTQMTSDEILNAVEQFTFEICDYVELSDSTEEDDLDFLDDDDDIEYAMNETITFSHVIKTATGVYFICTDFTARWEDTFRPMLCVGDDEQIERVFIVCDDNNVRGIEYATDYYGMS